ncbi:MAG TPA: insulinase family protein, partial [Flavisolibacter sp.]|nr:insulinase family protein [Flavisolibacter sp.]
DPHEKYPVPEFVPLTKTDYFIQESSIAQTPYIMLNWHGPDFRNDSAATLAADVFSTALGLNSSKWQQALIDKGLATYAGISYQTNKYVGPIQIIVVPNPAKMKECYSEMMKQIAQFSDPNYITDEELQTAKEVLVRNEIRNTEKPSGLASQLTYWWASTSLDYYTDYINNLTKVSKKDMVDYVNKYIKGKPYIAGMIINAEMNAQLKPAEYFKQKDN